MNKSEKQIAQAAQRFAERWQGKGYEKGESQTFWLELLTEVFGVKEPSTFITFEEQVKLDATNFIDGHIPSTRVLIEQKSLGKDLRQPIKQSDGTYLTPFQQAKRYVTNLPVSMHPRWIVTSNFSTFLVYDMENPTGDPFEIQLADLGKEYYRLRFLVETDASHLEREMQVSMQAGAIVGKLYDALLAQYLDPTNAESLRSLNVLCVRLVFCLYSEDAGIFGPHDMFHDYLARYDIMDMRNALVRLFKTLDTPLDERDPYLQDDLAAFPYVNGGLFGGDIEIPRFNEEIRDLLLHHASLDFDWSEISPTIFGAVFESTLNPETRRSGGMHYTSIENIHKVIDPLFLDDLRGELDNILAEKVPNKRRRRLLDYQERLASLTFLDPACGSGNFLTETYLSLRRLENRLIRSLYEGQAMFIGGEFQNPVRVSIHQFYGIEINDFAKTVATTALWISEAQMLAETERIVARDIDFLPLKTYPNIAEGNALRMDWRSLFSKTTESSQISEHSTCLPDYIMGNPPFVGARMMSAGQKEDLIDVFGAKWKNIGNMDYVCGWYKKAADLMRGTAIKTALVSTNSICQGEQVANLWQPLMQDGITINFAHRTFRWDSEAKIKAHVHCIIVGFSATNSPSNLRGGAANGGGGVDNSATIDTLPADSASGNFDAPATPPPPALRATSPQAGEESSSSYPRGRISHATNSPSKTRGGAANGGGGVDNTAAKDTLPADSASGNIDAPATPPPPALRATSPQAGEESSSSYPRFGISHATNSPSKIRGGAAIGGGGVDNSTTMDTLPADSASSNFDAPATPPPPALRATSPQAGEESSSSYPRGRISPAHRVMNTADMKDFRRDLRSHGTSAEATLWKMLKGKQVAGLQFRRQFSVGDHILDFYCPALKLAIELDGDYHYHMEMPDRDYKRDNILLEKHGIKTLRFENKIVFQHPGGIIFAIMQEKERQTNSPSKIRGGAAIGGGGVDNSATMDTLPADSASGNFDAPATPPPPALRATSPQAGEESSPSYPRGGSAHATNSPSKIRGGAAIGGGGVDNTAAKDTLPADSASGNIDAPATPPPPALRATSPQAGEESSPSYPRGRISPATRVIFDGERVIPVQHINAYLIDGPDTFVSSRSKPLCDVPEIGIGNKPIDGGNYLFEKEEMEEFIKQEPKSEQYFRPWYGSVEFIHQKPRYCLWLGDCSPAELRSMPHCLKRIEAVREMRLASKSEGTRKLADTPTRFHVENMPKGNFIIVPKVSSERRSYVPMGFMTPDAFASDLVFIIPDATLHHFGVLESSAHMAWMRAVCGRLEMRYRYSKDVVYNNFPWPEVNEVQRERIEQTAQAILDARALYPDSSLADLYDPVTMPPELLKAHRDNDRAVMAAYGFPSTMSESEIVAHLFALYTELTR